MPCVHGDGMARVWGTKAKPLAAYRRRLCCLAVSYITALAPAVMREAEEDWGR
jgi:hypothetical protein